MSEIFFLSLLIAFVIGFIVVPLILMALPQLPPTYTSRRRTKSKEGR